MTEMDVWLCWNHDSEQVTPASSEWSQLCMFQDIWEQPCREFSSPVHFRLSSRMVPVPGPKKASPQAAVASPQPNWRHTTLASGRSQASSHTVPQLETEYISTRPSHLCWPPTNLTDPTQGKKTNSVRGKWVLSLCSQYLKLTFRGWCGSCGGYPLCYSEVTSVYKVFCKGWEQQKKAEEHSEACGFWEYSGSIKWHAERQASLIINLVINVGSLSLGSFRATVQRKRLKNILLQCFPCLAPFSNCKRENLSRKNE